MEPNENEKAVIAAVVSLLGDGRSVSEIVGLVQQTIDDYTDGKFPDNE